MKEALRRTAITRIEVKNFKSFDELNLSLGNYNVLIGPNASGKSNFLELLRFLSDTTKHGLRNAISMQGGKDFFLNNNIANSSTFSVKISCSLAKTMGFPFPSESTKTVRFIDIKDFTYELQVKFQEKDFEVAFERLELKCDILMPKNGKISKRQSYEKLLETTEVTSSGKIFVTRENGVIKARKRGIPEDIYKYCTPSVSSAYIDSKKTFLESSMGFWLLDWKGIFQGAAIYDVDPKLPKRAISFTGKQDLESDGSNLTIILKAIDEDPEKKKRFSTFLNNLLPHAKSISVGNVGHKALIFNVIESYEKQMEVPASLISEGTINIIALIYILYFQRNPLVLIEEPEKNIHPRLLSKIANILADASRQKQIIITTHNPDLVKYAHVENIFLVHRNKKGFSEIAKPASQVRLKKFLTEDIGVDELFKMDFLSEK